LTAASSPLAETSTSDVLDTDRAAVADLIEAINQTAAGPVAAQQQLLASVVEPGFDAEQAACAAATITIRIDPVLPDLRADPEWRPDPGTATNGTDALKSPASAVVSAPAGTLYRVPVLIEVYTESFRTGTDMTTLRLSVIDGVAHTFPLCLV
jgi:hypothetical protein